MPEVKGDFVDRAIQSCEAKVRDLRRLLRWEVGTAPVRFPQEAWAEYRARVQAEVAWIREVGA